MVMASVMVISLEEPLFVVVIAGGDKMISGNGCRKVDGPESRWCVVDAYGGVLNWGERVGGAHRCFGIMGIPPPAGTFGGTLTKMSLGIPKGS